MFGGDVMAFVAARSRWSPLRAESARFWRSGAVVVRKNSLWELDPDTMPFDRCGRLSTIV
jgi:hypothetical protein